MDELLKPITTPISKLMAEQSAEAEAEEISRHTPISYWCTLFDDCVFSPREFYEIVERNIARRQVPDLLRDCISLHEGTVFSRRRLYLQMRRERIVAEICAAPFGSGFFISSRLFDRRRHAYWWDYVIAIAVLLFCSLLVLSKYGWVAALVAFGILITTVWSLMRLATSTRFAKLDEWISMIPWIGPIYETWFHPNTYYRQDTQNMYREAVNRSVREAVGELTTQKGLKPLTEDEFRPILAALR
jgi:hypothetical protein